MQTILNGKENNLKNTNHWKGLKFKKAYINKSKDFNFLRQIENQYDFLIYKNVEWFDSFGMSERSQNLSNFL